MLRKVKMIILSVLMMCCVNSAIPGMNTDNINHYLNSKIEATSKNEKVELGCLIKAVHGEAGNQSFMGKVAVAHVIMNRYKHEAFPDKLCKVIYQRGQFDFVNQKPRHRVNEAENSAVRDSIRAATLVIRGKIGDPTRGSLYFVNPKIATDRKWLRKLIKVTEIGDHAFYRKKYS